MSKRVITLMLWFCAFQLLEAQSFLDQGYLVDKIPTIGQVHFLDVDADGDKDAVVTNQNEIFYFYNENGRFEKLTYNDGAGVLFEFASAQPEFVQLFAANLQANSTQFVYLADSSITIFEYNVISQKLEVATTIQDIKSVRFADVNNDNLQDAIGFRNGQLVYLIQDANGSFGDATIVTSKALFQDFEQIASDRYDAIPQDRNTFEALDWDKDGDVDIVSFSAERDSLWLLENDANTFQAQLLYAQVGAEFSDFYVEEFLNDDAYKDLLLTYDNNQTISLQNMGNNSFETKDSIPLIAAAIVLADFDGDGDPDVLTRTTENEFGETYAVFGRWENKQAMGFSNANFTPIRINTTASDTWSYPEDVIYRYLNNDNKLDLVIQMNHAFYGSSCGSTGYADEYHYWNADTVYQISNRVFDHHQAIDTDGNGFVETVIAQPNYLQITQLPNEVDFSPTCIFGDASNNQSFFNAYPLQVDFEDINEDGMKDIVANSARPYLGTDLYGFGINFYSYFMEKQGNASYANGFEKLFNEYFDECNTTLLSFATSDLTNMEMHDFNNDSKKELISMNTTNYCYDPSTITFSVQKPNFNPTTISSDSCLNIENFCGQNISSQYNGVASLSYESTFNYFIYDLEGDSDVDIIYNFIGDDGYAVGVLENDGDGNFKDSLLIESFDFIYGVVDANNDGLADFIANRYDYKLHLRQPDGSFLEEPLFTSANGASAKPFDINADGHDDLFFLENGNIWLLYNDPQANFLEPLLIDSVDADIRYGTNMLFEDLNLDGSIDIVIQKQKSLFIYLQTNDGFEAVADLPELENIVFDVAIGQIDDDNKPDLLLTVQKDVLHWWSNNFVVSSTSNNLIDAKKIQLFPNPSNGRLQLTNLPKSATHIQLFNPTGKLLSTFNCANQNEFSRQFNQLASGMYLLKITDETNQLLATKKWLVL